MSEETRAVSAEEESVGFSGPAISANRVLVHIGAAGVRISFVEQWGDRNIEFRTAVMMPMQDAIALKNLLTGLLSDIERQVEDAKSAAQAAQSGG